MPVTFLRPAWFIENAACDVGPAHDTGVLASFLQPLDKPFPMVATGDVGRMRNPQPRIRMLDGFNEGWIDFSAGGRNTIKGSADLLAVLRTLLDRSDAPKPPVPRAGGWQIGSRLDLVD